jgi:polyhydroxyalkanoate synthase subunit PhaE
MSSKPPFGVSDPMAFGRQVWDTWTEFAQQQAQAAKPAANGAAAFPNWHEGLEFWSRLTGRAPGEEANHAVEQLTQHGQRMLQMMQSLATRGSGGKPVSAEEVVDAWKAMYAGGNPMLDTIKGIATEGARGWDNFARGLEPTLALLRDERNSWLGMPAFGVGRERQERMQAIAAAQQEYAERSAAYNALLAKASQEGLAVFESKLSERSEPGRQVDSMRALYDLWIDSAEEAYADVALSPEFRAAYGAMVNAQMRLKQRVQQELDHNLAELGMPNRAELDGAHRKIHAMQRELRDLREQVRALAGGSAAARSQPAARAPAPKPSPKQAAAKKSAPAKRAPAKKQAPARGKAKARASTKSTSRS